MRALLESVVGGDAEGDDRAYDYHAYDCHASCCHGKVYDAGISAVCHVVAHDEEGQGAWADAEGDGEADHEVVEVGHDVVDDEAASQCRRAEVHAHLVVRREGVCDLVCRVVAFQGMALPRDRHQSLHQR